MKPRKTKDRIRLKKPSKESTKLIRPKIKTATVLDGLGYLVLIVFNDCEVRIFDFEPIIKKTLPFRSLEDKQLFLQMKYKPSHIHWGSDLKYSVEDLYYESEDFEYFNEKQGKFLISEFDDIRVYMFESDTLKLPEIPKVHFMSSYSPSFNIVLGIRTSEVIECGLSYLSNDSDEFRDLANESMLETIDGWMRLHRRELLNRWEDLKTFKDFDPSNELVPVGGLEWKNALYPIAPI